MDRSQVRRILLEQGDAGGTRGRGRPAATQSSLPKGPRSYDLYTHPPAGVTVVCADELGPVVPRTLPTGTGLVG